jgi:hypothetical protein
MSETPPRRRRPGAAQPAGSLPLIPILIGVIVLGFAVGAGLSLLTRGSGAKTVALASPTPLAMPFTSPPSAHATSAAPHAALATHRPAMPQPAALSVPRIAPATVTPATETPATEMPATERPATETPATEAPASAPPATRAPATPEPVRRTPAPTPRPRPARTPIPTPFATAPPTLTPTPPSGPRIAADTGFGKRAADLVRSYLDALIAGDDASARAALGGSGTLGEKSVVDANTTIASIDAESSGASAIVRVQLSTPRGPVFARYSVERNADGPFIREHSFTKP